MSPETTTFLVFFLVSFCVNLVFVAFFFMVKQVIDRIFENFRNFFSRNTGWGYLLILMPEGRLVEKFIKMDSTMKVKTSENNEDTYLLKSDRVFSYRGLPALLYNKGDSEPVDIKGNNQGDAILFRNASFLDSLIIKIKAYAEAKAFKKFEMIITLLFVIAGLTIVAVGISGYGVFSFVEFREAIYPILESIKTAISQIPITAGVLK